MKHRLLVLAMAASACAGDSTGKFALDAADVASHDTAYIAVVVAEPEGDDLQRGAGEYVVLRNNWDLRADIGGWSILDADDNRLRVGIGTQMDPGAELRVYTSCGTDSPEAVFSCLDLEVLDDDGDVLRLVDAGGTEVMRFAYGNASSG